MNSPCRLLACVKPALARDCLHAAGVIILLSLAGCPVPPAGDSTDDAGSPAVLHDVVNYGFDIQPIFDKNCVKCHTDNGIAEGLGVPMHLNSGQARADLIDQPSSKNSAVILVIPGDPDNSLLYQKVASDFPPIGLRMPLFDQPLRPEEIELIRRWIEQGAAP